MGTIVGREEKGAVDVGQVAKVRLAGSQEYVLDEDRAVRRAVALPQYGTVGAIGGGLGQGLVHDREVERVGPPGPPGTAEKSLTRTVLSAVPSLFHNS